NAAGGLLGRRVELRFKDDGSEAVRAGEAYAELIRDGVQVLIGPYGSAATLTAAAEAERGRRVLLNAAGPSSEVHKRQPQYVFQTLPPYAAYADGALWASRGAGVESLYIAARDDAASRDMAEAAQTQARALGFTSVALAIYSGRTDDFLPLLYQAMQVNADGWIAFGEARDAAELVKILKKQGYVPKLVYARAAVEPRFIKLVGQDAEFVLGSKDYDPRFSTAGNAEFVKAFTAKWSAPPGPLAAAGYTAGVVLAAAVRRAGSVEPQKLRSALATLQVDTVLGPYRVDPASGAQVGMKPVLLQIVKGRAQPVWPEAFAGERSVLPFAPWADRQVLR
ncbi:MAG TPA: ABC transporter substrate-binding protein, partial [Burkholderiales bacterium]|nr:ABC transporter substrate-binding protein [Burkholderiales bacterium]